MQITRRDCLRYLCITSFAFASLRPLISLAVPTQVPFTDIEVYSVEKGERVLVDPVYATAKNFVGRPLNGYRVRKAFSYSAIIDSLIKINAEFRPIGFQLLVKDAYRPVQASEDMVRWARENGHTELIGPYIAEKSSHNSGRSVDVTLATLDGQEVWMGSLFDEFNQYAHYNQSREHTVSDDRWTYNSSSYFIDPKRSVKELRAILQKAMINHGFKPYPSEWWHFTRDDLPSRPFKNPIE